MKQILFLFSLIAFVCIAMGQNASNCYATSYNKGVDAYNQKKYVEAKKFFNAALECSIKPAHIDVDAWLKKCNQAIAAQNSTKQKYDGAVVFYIFNPDLMTDEENANILSLPNGWILFEDGVCKVNEEQMKTIRFIAHTLKNHLLDRGYKCCVRGVSSFYGSDEYNMRNAEKRAVEVGRILYEEFHFTEEQVTVRWGYQTALIELSLDLF